MRRMGFVLGLTLCVAMLLCTLSLLIRPVFAESCTANCAGGGRVTCYGYKCTAKDGDGCRSWDQNGSLIIAMDCGGELLEMQ